MNRRTFLSLVAAGTFGLTLPVPVWRETKEELVARLVQNALDAHDAMLEDIIYNGGLL